MWAMLRDGTRYDPTMTRPRERHDPAKQTAEALAVGEEVSSAP